MRVIYGSCNLCAFYSAVMVPAGHVGTVTLQVEGGSDVT